VEESADIDERPVKRICRRPAPLVGEKYLPVGHRAIMEAVFDAFAMDVDVEDSREGSDAGTDAESQSDDDGDDAPMHVDGLDELDVLSRLEYHTELSEVRRTRGGLGAGITDGLDGAPTPPPTPTRRSRKGKSASSKRRKAKAKAAIVGLAPTATQAATTSNSATATTETVTEYDFVAEADA
jgi:hypothetical protein